MSVEEPDFDETQPCSFPFDEQVSLLQEPLHNW